MSKADDIVSAPPAPTAMAAQQFGDATATNRGLTFQGTVNGNVYFPGECIFSYLSAWRGLANDSIVR